MVRTVGILLIVASLGLGAVFVKAGAAAAVWSYELSKDPSLAWKRAGQW